MKIAYIASYPPRQCGIGAFTQNKLQSMLKSKSAREDGFEGIVIAMTDRENRYDYPDEVAFTIRQDHQEDYMEAARYINWSGVDVCILEHEFGIFGGEAGSFLLTLLHRLEIPVISVFHTVLKNPSAAEKNVLTEVSRLSAKTVVMSNKAVEFLKDIYHISKEKIALIEHGVPDLQYDPKMCKREFKLENKKVILTFGLIGRNKGIETVIKALPAVVAQYPDVVYIVLGKTHPAVLKHAGEEYRESLQQLVEDLKLEENVFFLNEFVNERKLMKYLSAADIYVTPYLNEAQITSGTLSYAVGAGCAVISTPYWHATELLAEGKGRLFDFHDDRQLSSIFMDLLQHPLNMGAMRERARNYGREITWPRIGEKYMHLARKVLNASVRKSFAPEPVALPPFALDHVKRLTDDTGIIQHAKFGIPNLKEGYCLDDNARALLMSLMAYQQKKYPLVIELLPVYLSYIHYMQTEEGLFRNFLSFNRNFLDEVGSEDSFGRTIWALGYLLGNAPHEAYYQVGKEIFFRSIRNFDRLQCVRAIANTMIGISHYLDSNSTDQELRGWLRRLSDKLVSAYENNHTDGWEWFEPTMTYDNALLPLSLLHAAEHLNDERLMQIATDTMEFLLSVTMKNGYLSVIGNEGWYEKGGTAAVFAQQPVDAMAMVLLLRKAFQLTKDKTYSENMHVAFMWFLGQNELHLSLYDHETGGCYDGLEAYGINRNQGAESSLAYLIAHLSILQAMEETGNRDNENIHPIRTTELTEIPARVVTI